MDDLFFIYIISKFYYTAFIKVALLICQWLIGLSIRFSFYRTEVNRTEIFWFDLIEKVNRTVCKIINYLDRFKIKPIVNFNKKKGLQYKSPKILKFLIPNSKQPSLSSLRVFLLLFYFHSHHFICKREASKTLSLVPNIELQFSY